MYEIAMKIRCWTRRTRPQNLLAAGEVDEVHTPGRRHPRGRVPLPEHDHKHRVAPRGPTCIFRCKNELFAAKLHFVSKFNARIKMPFKDRPEINDVYTFILYDASAKRTKCYFLS